jgi:CHAD domain-containing protein
VIKGRDAAQALAAVTSECLEHIVRNTAVLCEVDTAGVCRAATPEHVHQLRVGIRRLRSAWSFFDGLTELPSPEHRQKINSYFSQLGGTRDEDVLKESILPLLAVAGLPPLVLPISPRQDSNVQNVASTDFQSWLLDTLAQCTIPSITSAALTTPPAATITASSTDFEFPRALHAARKPALKPLLVKKLKKWHQQIVRNGLIFQTLDIEQQHALRKKSKRLRYALQYCETLFPESKLSLYRKQLATVQDILGEMNDLYVAQPLFESLKTDQPQAWFACGWIQARLGTLTKEAAEAFKNLQKPRPPGVEPRRAAPLAHDRRCELGCDKGLQIFDFFADTNPVNRNGTYTLTARSDSGQRAAFGCAIKLGHDQTRQFHGRIKGADLCQDVLSRVSIDDE